MGASGELPAIFRWATLGLDRLRKRGWTESAVCNAEFHDYQLERNPTREYLQDLYKAADVDSWVVIKDCYRLYREHMNDSGLKPLGVSQFGQEVRRVFPGVERRQLRAENRKRCYVGMTDKGDLDD